MTHIWLCGFHTDLQSPLWVCFLRGFHIITFQEKQTKNHLNFFHCLESVLRFLWSPMWLVSICGICIRPTYSYMGPIHIHITLHRCVFEFVSDLQQKCLASRKCPSNSFVEPASSQYSSKCFTYQHLTDHHFFLLLVSQFKTVDFLFENEIFYHACLLMGHQQDTYCYTTSSLGRNHIRIS